MSGILTGTKGSSAHDAKNTKHKYLIELSVFLRYPVMLQQKSVVEHHIHLFDNHSQANRFRMTFLKERTTQKLEIVVGSTAYSYCI